MEYQRTETNKASLKIVVAFDSFKGCISAKEACDAAADGIRSLFPEADIVRLPLSDGGEGLVECVGRLLPVASIALTVHGPLMDVINCSYALSPDGKTAYMEMAAAGGLTLIAENKRNPLDTTTYGVGEMIADAVGRGCERIVMGIGGSATCDAGEGMLKALRDHDCLNTPCKFVVACDVANPLYGKNGAAYVFAPQKGATPGQVVILDNRLRAFARKTEEAGIASPDKANYPGAGAAGGLGYAFLTHLKAELQSGIDIILDIARFDEMIEEADLVITGEGKSDAQTMMGKVACGVQKHCMKAAVPVWLLSGAIDDSGSTLSGCFNRVHSINEYDSRLPEQLLRPEVAKENIGKTVKRIMESTWFKMSRPEDKAAIVMGATSGIGYEVARLLAQRGWRVGIAGRREDVMSKMVSETDGIVACEVIDVTTPRAIDGLHRLIGKLGKMDLYFHSSGIGYKNTALETDKELRTIETNCLGMARLTGEAFRYFASHPETGGQIAVISSIARTKGLGAAPAYSASKRFTSHYLESLCQLASIKGIHNIHITDIRPGFVRTPLIEGSHFPMQLDATKVAADIVDALERRKAVVTINRLYRILVFFWQMIPRWIWTKMKII